MSYTNNLIDEFIYCEINDLQEEGGYALSECDATNDYHMLSYWLTGTYDNVKAFVNKNYSENLHDAIISKYPFNLVDLKCKLKATYGDYSKKILAYEALASILLSEMQRYYQWYSVFGSEEVDMIDFNKYEINSALVNHDEFPVVKQEDIVAAMYGINNTLQPSDLYDIFAHFSDKLKRKNKNIEDVSIEPTFTPDVFLSAAVVARYKNYMDMSKKINSDYAVKFLEISNYKEESIKALLILNYALNDYKVRYSATPNGLPLHSNMIDGNFITIDGAIKYSIKYRIRGIKNSKTVWDDIAEIRYDVPETIEEFQKFIIQIAIDFKRELNGLEKVRNKDIDAIEGKYPNKFSSTHGLTYASQINIHYRDKRGNDFKKPMICNYSLALAEKQSLYLIKKSLRYATVNPVVSSSFGIDSITTLHMLRRVNRHNYSIVFNNSNVEYPELIKYKKQICSDWNLNDKLIETKPIESYWDIQKKWGWNFNRKGDRRDGKSNSEACCMAIKHQPMYNQIDQFITEGNPMQVNFTGLRASESRSREQSCKRDNVVYFSKSWKSIRVNPITFFSEEMIWAYQKKYNIPYCDVYDKVVYYEDVYDKVSDEEYHKLYYKPRVGCWTCLLNKNRGYLNFLKMYYPKKYQFLMFNMGLAKDIFIPGAQKLGIISDNIILSKPQNNQLSMFDVEEELQMDKEKLTIDEIMKNYSLEDMESLIMKRPCKFLA